MTKPFQEKTVQPSYSTYNSRTDLFPHYHGSKKKNIIKIYNASEKFYSDQTGSFPITFSKGSRYGMIVYEYNSNHIHGEPIKYCNAADFTRSYEKVHKMFIS